MSKRTMQRRQKTRRGRNKVTRRRRTGGRPRARPTAGGGSHMGSLPWWLNAGAERAKRRALLWKILGFVWKILREYF